MVNIEKAISTLQLCDPKRWKDRTNDVVH